MTIFLVYPKERKEEAVLRILEKKNKKMDDNNNFSLNYSKKSPEVFLSLSHSPPPLTPIFFSWKSFSKSNEKYIKKKF
jgi:hypothetical protein